MGYQQLVLVSFPNVGERLPSSKEQFLLFGGNVEENSSARSAGKGFKMFRKQSF